MQVNYEEPRVREDAPRRLDFRVMHRALMERDFSAAPQPMDPRQDTCACPFTHFECGTVDVCRKCLDM